MSERYAVLIEGKPLWKETETEAWEFFDHNEYLRPAWSMEVVEVFPCQRLEQREMVELLKKLKELQNLVKGGDYVAAAALACELMAQFLSALKNQPIPNLRMAGPLGRETALAQLGEAVALYEREYGPGAPKTLQGAIPWNVILPVVYPVVKAILKELVDLLP